MYLCKKDKHQPFFKTGVKHFLPYAKYFMYYDNQPYKKL